jgi:hypothetical protein
VLPFVLLAACLGLWAGHELPSPDPPTPELLVWAESDLIALQVSAAASLAAVLPRLHAALRFRQSWRSALLHPLGVLALLAIQWYAILRAVIGRPVGWKGRAHPASKPTQYQTPN